MNDVKQCTVCSKKLTKANKIGFCAKHRNFSPEFVAENKRRAKMYTIKNPDYNYTVNKRFHAYKRNAKLRNISFDITKEQFEAITKKRCIYCDKFSLGRDFSGIDRIVNDLRILARKLCSLLH
jgi:hypothetical protein